MVMQHYNNSHTVERRNLLLALQNEVHQPIDYSVLVSQSLLNMSCKELAWHSKFYVHSELSMSCDIIAWHFLKQTIRVP